MEAKTQDHDYITEVLESEELFIQQLLEMQQYMNKVAQESLTRRQVYEKSLAQIEQREEKDFKTIAIEGYFKYLCYVWHASVSNEVDLHETYSFII